MGTDWTKRLKSPAKFILSPEIESFLSKPTWSVKSLLPEETSETESEITREKLQHLLRLSALPQPRNRVEEDQMLNTLKSQVHFVKEIQRVDTKGVEPLQAIRDENEEAINEKTIKLDDLAPYLDQEEKVGRNGTLRRRRKISTQADDNESGLWNALSLGAASGSRTLGRYFFVKKQKRKVEENMVNKEASEG